MSVSKEWKCFYEQLYSVSQCIKCVYVNVRASGSRVDTCVSLGHIPVGHILDLILPTPQLQPCLLDRSSPPPFLGFITLIAEPGYPPPHPRNRSDLFLHGPGPQVEPYDVI